VTTDVMPGERGRRGDSQAAKLQAALERLGLRGIHRVRLTRNRTVMVSFSQGELRVHEGYLDAPVDVLRAIVGFVCGRTRADRRRAREQILAHQIARPAAVRRPERPRPEDEPVIAQLRRFHAHYNRVYFGGRLRGVPIRLSGRMRTRLGHYTAATPTGEPAEIVIGREHIRRHGWEEALHTLLHEMVHQWQDEAGHPIDHGGTFRKKAREVGITASARRHVLPKKQRTLTPPPPTLSSATLGLRAAREE
ncbi:MAG TPA: SprT-like domain-containing protein, partial [Gemmatimonadaceae bacterium]|nr:SprT-like domain-containing protein [Gemmatimonadaceae bacterium]